MTNHPITPLPELLQKWYDGKSDYWTDMICAARWGADQELEACCLLLDSGEHAATYGCHDGTSLRAARRPKPQSLKSRALKAALIELDPKGKNGSLIFQALEQLPND